MKKFLLAASFAILSASGYSQVRVNSCGTDQHHQHLVSEHPELKEAKKKFDAGFKEFIKTYKPSDQTSLAIDIITDIERYRSLLLVMKESGDLDFYNKNKVQFNTYITIFERFGREKE